LIPRGFYKKLAPNGSFRAKNHHVQEDEYFSLAARYHLVPIAIETLGSLGDEAMQFFWDLGRRVAAETGEPRSLQFLLQRVSVAIQHGNAACVIGTVRQDCSWDDIFICSSIKINRKFSDPCCYTFRVCCEI
jgi:hypothetical protein